jgi:predicted Fe-Mo cluster-binding NifX family protein
MSCYFRHLQAIFSEAGIEVTSANRKQIDEAVHRIVNVSYKDCPATWKKIKLGTADSESKKEFIQKLKIAVQKI